jgi:AAHS family 4-hydroxybenzoate transporter-like MFS transporter
MAFCQLRGDMTGSVNEPVSLGSLLDVGPWTSRQKLIATMVALAVMFDGFDTTLLGLTVVAIAHDIQLKLESFSLIFAAGLLGMSIGAVIGGRLGDRWGRRPLIIAAVVIFSVLTGWLALADHLAWFVILRLAAGLGLGCLMPNASALVAEITPRRFRSMAVMLVMMSIALGGIMAGVVVTLLMPTAGWRGLFLLGGMVPLLAVAVLAWKLPESPRYLAIQGRSAHALLTTLSRLGIDRDAKTTFIEDSGIVTTSSRRPLGKEYRADAAALAIAFFFCLLCSYSFNSWLPAALHAAGIPDRKIGAMTSMFHLGSVLGIPIGSLFMTRLGSKRLLAGLSGGATLGALGLSLMSSSTVVGILLLSALMVIEAAMIAIVQVALFSLAVNMFDTTVRTAGVGITSGFGRLGALASAFTAALSLNSFGASGFFVSIAMGMLLTMFALMIVRRHIAPA